MRKGIAEQTELVGIAERNADISLDQRSVWALMDERTMDDIIVIDGDVPCVGRYGKAIRELRLGVRCYVRTFC